MKRLIVAVIIFITIVTIIIASDIYVRKTVDYFDSEISKIIERVKDKNPQAKNSIDVTVDQWEKARSLLVLFIERELCDDISDELSDAKFGYGIENDAVLFSLNNCRIVLQKILETQSISAV